MRTRPPLRVLLRCWLAGLVMVAATAPAGAAIVVIGHPGLPRIDEVTVQKLYTGKLVELNGVGVMAANAAVGSNVRVRFLKSFLEQDEEKYVAYWTVRRYIGKGTPPRELVDAEDMIRFVQATPGGVGYIDESELKAGLNVLVRK